MCPKVGRLAEKERLYEKDLQRHLLFTTGWVHRLSFATMYLKAFVESSLAAMPSQDALHFQGFVYGSSKMYEREN